MVAGAAALLTIGQLRTAAERCNGAAERLRGVWSPERAQRLRNRLLASDAPLAADTAGRVLAELDRYAVAWRDADTSACRDTRVHGTHSEGALDLRVACLDERRTALAATVELLEAESATAAVDHTRAVYELPRLERCSDMTALRADVPPPEDPAVAAAARELRGELALAHARAHVGRYRAALAIAQRVAAAATRLGYDPLVAEGLAARGDLELELGELAGAEQTLQQAYWTATGARHDPVAAAAAAGVVEVLLAAERPPELARGLGAARGGGEQASRSRRAPATARIRARRRGAAPRRPGRRAPPPGGGARARQRAVRRPAPADGRRAGSPRGARCPAR